MKKGPLEIFLFNNSGSPSCKDAHVYLSDLLEVVQMRIVSHVPSLKGQEINVIVSDKSAIQKLNAQFRNIDSPTDVLAFPRDGDLIGEVWLCPAVVKENAKKYDQEYEKELVRVLIHGLLHIAEYDHEGSFTSEDEAQTEEMFKIQEAILADIEG